MLKQGLLALILAITGFATGATQAQQVYGNEWVNFTQSYYKINVAQTGLYQLSYGYLDSLGLGSVNPRHLQLFRRGKEVAIYIAGEEDGRLDPGDYLEFFGERNDGVLDQELYKDPAHQVHQLYSLYTDTAAYFLTVNAAGGKRMREVNPAATGRTPEPYHLQRLAYVNTDRYNLGKVYGENRMPWMDEGEGYFSHYSINPRSYTIRGITNIAPSGPVPVVEFATVGAYPEYHKFTVNLQLPDGSTRKLNTYEYDFFGSAKDRQLVAFSDISPQGVLSLQIVPDATPTKGNAISFAYGRLTYPQQPLFLSPAMLLYTDSARTVMPYYELSGAPATAVAYDVTDQGNIVRIGGHAVGADKRGFVIGAEDGRSHKILVADAAKPFKPGPGKKISFRKLDPQTANYLILTNKRLLATNQAVPEPAPKSYAAYRASAAGGGYDTLLVYVDELVNQFHYGEYSPSAIRRFVGYMAQSPGPKQLLILGKGIEPNRINYSDAASRALDLVPTGGSPASDLLFAIDYRHDAFVPSMPVGRLAATSPADIIAYLNKVKAYEAAEEGAAWRKNILQLGGGKTAREISQIASYLNSYKQIAEGPLLGATVLEKYRQNVSEIVETINVSEEVNRGLSLITFFGHSAAGTTDLDIGYVSRPGSPYQNKGKYPVLFMNGCNAGNAFIPDLVSFGEDWLKEPDKGAVAFIAHVDLGYPNFLNLYASLFYTVAFQDPDFYGKSLGQVQQETIRRVNNTTASSLATAMITQVALQGDPALRLYTPSQPDYLVADTGFKVEGLSGGLVTATADSLLVSVNVQNLGKAIMAPVYVSVKRTLPDNSVLFTDSLWARSILREQTLQLKLPNKPGAALGMNRFEIRLDSPDVIPELQEANNVKVFQHFFPGSGLAVLSPAPYAVVGTDKVRLMAQATQLENNRQGYYFELDTTRAFSSSAKLSHTADYALLPVWDLTLPQFGAASDSTVFYWRVRFQHYTAGEDTVWAEGSFRFIQGAGGGWSQSHPGQLQDNKLEDVEISTIQKPVWRFSGIKSDIEIRTVGGDIRYNEGAHGLFIDGRPVIETWCSDPAGSATPRMYLVVFDPLDLSPRPEVISGGACIHVPYLYEFGNLNTAANRDKLLHFLRAVPARHYVAAISVNQVPFESFSPELKTAFGALGSGLINGLRNGYPFAMVGQQGAAPGTARELTASDEHSESKTAQYIALQTRLQSTKQAGTITSTLIGPALSWGTLHHRIAAFGDGNDAYTLQVYGIDAEGQEQLLSDHVPAKSFDLSGIDAKAYPSLRLSALLSDSAARTAPQLAEWLVFYEAAPEGVLRPDLVQVSGQLLTEQAAKGEIALPMAFQNITPTAFSDSLTVQVSLTGQEGEALVSRFKIKPVAGNETVNFTYRMPTFSLVGDYKLSLYVNPRILPEQAYFNNIYEVSFRVRPRLHPILDVAFDGVHILDGDLVSPSPLISMTVKDENRHAYLQDPSSMSVVLTDPQGQAREVSPASNPDEVQYFPADEKNDFRLEYKPAKLENGRYKLEVRARDVTGKASGISPYQISFEVENESQITNFYPFPNPFSSQTHFIFTLTGSALPEDFKIQILTVTGKVVKEIMKEELGPLRIGNNKTAYAWDGTDMFGDKLANGVYLYRVVMRSGHEEMKHRYTAGDKAFKNGYGKLYILR